jgi:hypothetical protein
MRKLVLWSLVAASVSVSVCEAGWFFRRHQMYQNYECQYQPVYTPSAEQSTTAPQTATAADGAQQYRSYQYGANGNVTNGYGTTAQQPREQKVPSMYRADHKIRGH